jgi:hypothetical protein
LHCIVAASRLFAGCHGNVGCTSCYRKPGAAGKDQRKVVTAVARELLGFIWGIETSQAAPRSLNKQTIPKKEKTKRFHDEQRYPSRASEPAAG